MLRELIEAVVEYIQSTGESYSEAIRMATENGLVTGTMPNRGEEIRGIEHECK